MVGHAEEAKVTRQTLGSLLACLTEADHQWSLTCTTELQNGATARKNHNLQQGRISRRIFGLGLSPFCTTRTRRAPGLQYEASHCPQKE